MNEKLKKRIIFVITDTVYWIITIVVGVLLLVASISFLYWDLYSFRALWGIIGLLLRAITIVSLIFALIGDWGNELRN